MYHCTEIQSRGCAVESVKSGVAFLHHERTQALEGDLFDSGIEIQSTRWEHLWIDVGGEG